LIAQVIKRGTQLLEPLDILFVIGGDVGECAGTGRDHVYFS
jgi:hypothetical protein